MPEKITIDGSAANEAAIQSYHAAHGAPIAMRKIKYLHKIVEQDHRAVQRAPRPRVGVKAFAAAQNTLGGIELMHMIKQRQMAVEAGPESLTAAEQFSALVATSPSTPESLTPKHLHTKTCDKTAQASLAFSEARSVLSLTFSAVRTAASLLLSTPRMAASLAFSAPPFTAPAVSLIPFLILSVVLPMALLLPMVMPSVVSPALQEAWMLSRTSPRLLGVIPRDTATGMAHPSCVHTPRQKRCHRVLPGT